MPRITKERGYVGFVTGRQYKYARGLGDYRWEPRPKSWQAVMLPEVQALLSTLAMYLPLRPRAILYRLMGLTIKDANGNTIKVTKADNERLIDLLSMARRGGQIEWEAIDDGRTVSHEREGYDDPLHYLQATIDHIIEHYMRKLRQGQRWYIELWVESAGYLPVLERTCDEYGVKMISGSGFNPVPSIRESALNALARWKKHGQRTLLVFLGDCDDSGITRIERTNADMRQFWIDQFGGNGETVEANGQTFTITTVCNTLIKSVMLGLTQQQAIDLALLDENGKRAVPGKPGKFELEAVPPDVVIDWVRACFEEHTDMTVLAETIESSEAEAKRLVAAIQRLIKRWK